MNIRQYSRGRKGFTLTELLTTIATIGVVASLLLPAVMKVKNKARDVQCLNNQRNIYYGMRSALTDVVPDESIHWNHDEEAEIIKTFYEGYALPFVKDTLLKEAGLAMSKPLTCPYGQPRGSVRAAFDIHWLKYFAKRPDLGKGVEGITGTYYFPINVPHGGYWDKTSAPAVECMWNYFAPKETTIGEYLKVTSHQEKFFSVGTTMLHPHKGEGKYVTYWSGAQKWVHWQKGMMHAPYEN